MSHIEIQKSLELLKKDWDIDPLIQDFILGKTSEVSDFTDVSYTHLTLPTICSV